jgi:hypothetical protein
MTPLPDYALAILAAVAILFSAAAGAVCLLEWLRLR